jgi:hypothetical protein
MDAGQGNGLRPFADSRAFCENLRRAENLRLQNNLSNRQKYFALYYKEEGLYGRFRILAASLRSRDTTQMSQMAQLSRKHHGEDIGGKAAPQTWKAHRPANAGLCRPTNCFLSI